MTTPHKSPAFWTHTSRFFLYPFQPTIAFMTSILACIPIWLATIVDPLIFWGLTGSFLLIFSTVLFVVLDHAMQGYSTPPKWSQLLTGGYLSSVAQQAAFLFGLVALLYFSDQHVGRMFAYGLAIILTFCLPAMLMILAASRQIIDALNPIKITEFIIKLKHHYFILLGMIFLIESGLILSFEYLQTQVPLVVAIHWTTFLTMFMSVTIFYLMGYVVFLHDKSGEQNGATVEDEDIEKEHPIINEIKNAIKSNQYDIAQELCNDALTLEPLNIELNDLCHRLSLIREDNELLIKHGNKYLRFLLQKNYSAKASEVFLNIFRKNSEYKLTEMENVIKLAKILYETKNHKTMIKLLDGLHQYYPNHPLIPKAYGFLAKTLHEDFGQDQDAKKILEYILITYPNHPIKHAVKIQLDKINKMKY